MPSKKTAFTEHWNNAMRTFATPRGRITLVALVCVVAAGILMAARQPVPSVDVTAVEFQAQDANVAVEQPSTAAAPVRPKPAASRPAGNAAGRTRTATAAASNPAAPATTVAAAAPARSPETVVASNRAAAVESGAKTTKVEASSAPVQAPSPATITGCLERDDDKFQLKDTEGESAPRSRSWRSGFLRRGTAAVDITDSANRLRLANHVGHRVTISGMLLEREMQARSLQMVADNCDN